jgi:hypothetical protein
MNLILSVVRRPWRRCGPACGPMAASFFLGPRCQSLKERLSTRTAGRSVPHDSATTGQQA